MIEYFNEDCMIGMARYPDKYFDLAIVDPPYGGNDAIGVVDSKNHLAGRTDYKLFDTPITIVDRSTEDGRKS